jgi:cell division protein FtsI/penicillin-binding protein 2
MNSTDMQRRAFLRVFTLFVAGFLAALGSLSYWILARAADLTQRLDNPRLALARFQLPRGRILDRNDQPLAISDQTDQGFYVRRYTTPSIGSLVGLLSPQLGVTGVEQAADQHLRGQQPLRAISMSYSPKSRQDPPPTPPMSCLRSISISSRPPNRRSAQVTEPPF